MCADVENFDRDSPLFSTQGTEAESRLHAPQNTVQARGTLFAVDIGRVVMACSNASASADRTDFANASSLAIALLMSGGAAKDQVASLRRTFWRLAISFLLRRLERKLNTSPNIAG